MIAPYNNIAGAIARDVAVAGKEVSRRVRSSARENETIFRDPFLSCLIGAENRMAGEDSTSIFPGATSVVILLTYCNDGCYTPATLSVRRR